MPVAHLPVDLGLYAVVVTDVHVAPQVKVRRIVQVDTGVGGTIRGVIVWKGRLVSATSLHVPNRGVFVHIVDGPPEGNQVDAIKADAIAAYASSVSKTPIDTELDD